MYCELPQFGRCCCCLPLRAGVLVWGCINIIFSALMVGLYSYSVHHDAGYSLVYHGVPAEVDDKLCVAIFCVDVLFNILLVYGALKKITLYLRIFYYYTITTVVAVVTLELATIRDYRLLLAFELMALFFVGLCIHLYLLFLVRSLLRKLEMSEQTYENQLHQFVNGDHKVNVNALKPSAVVPYEKV